MNRYNFPTTIFCGQGAIGSLVEILQGKAHRRVLIVTDPTLVEVGLLKIVTDRLDEGGVSYAIFGETRPNPTDDDVAKGTAAYVENDCDSLIALGGGSPMDVAKVIKIMATHPGPLAQYDDTLGGDRLITNPMPPLYAIPTTAGTGSEVGRSAVIIMRDSGKKTIFFHPSLMPDIAILEPEFTAGLPPHITAATGIDALVHSLEAYFAPGLHPMADGIALEGMALVIEWLPAAFSNGQDLEARERMLLAATMGAVAFQKGLGAIHSLAHPLSSRCGLHHGLANALLLPFGVKFLEGSDLNPEQRSRIAKVNSLFDEFGIHKGALSDSCESFVEDVGIELGLLSHGLSEDDLEALCDEAIVDPCHQFNMVPVDRDDLLAIYRAAL